MTKSKKSPKHHSSHLILQAGETILWQGKPNTTLSEYLRLKLFEVDDHIDGTPTRTLSNFIWGELTFQSKKNIRENQIISLLSLPIFIISFLVALNIFTSLMHLINDIYLNADSSISSLVDVLAYFLFFSLYFTFIAFFIKLLRVSKRLIQGLVEKRSGMYFVTDRRIIIYSNRWVHDFVFNNAVQHAVLRDSKLGQSITWYTLGNNYPVMPQFIGLSDFDIAHVLHTVHEHIYQDIIIHDEREKS